jgi:hypothetical protein
VHRDDVRNVHEAVARPTSARSGAGSSRALPEVSQSAGIVFPPPGPGGSPPPALRASSATPGAPTLTLGAAVGTAAAIAPTGSGFVVFWLGALLPDRDAVQLNVATLTWN